MASENVELEALLEETARLEEAGEFGPEAVAANERLLSEAERTGNRNYEHAAQMRLAEAAEHQGDFETMELWFAEAHERHGSEAAKNGLVRARTNRELLEEVLPSLEKVDDCSTFLNVGKEYRRRGRKDAAKTVYLAGRQRFSDSPELLNATAGLLRGLGEHKLALSHVRRSLELRPSLSANPAAHVTLGYLDCDVERFESAHELGARLLELHPRDSHVHFLLGWAGVRLDDHFEEGLRHLARADRLSGRDFDLMPWLERLRRKFLGLDQPERAAAVGTLRDRIRAGRDGGARVRRARDTSPTTRC